MLIYWQHSPFDYLPRMAMITDKQLIMKVAAATWLPEGSSKSAGRFYARLQPNKPAIFYFRYTDSNRKRRWLKLGPYHPKGHGGLTLKEARARADELSKRYMSGQIDLIEILANEKRLQQLQQTQQINHLESIKTFNEVYALWYELEASSHKDGGAEVARLFNKDILPVFGELDIDKVQTAHIHLAIDQVLRRGASRQARLVLSRIRQVFNFAFERELIDINPTARIKKSKIGTKSNERDRVLDPQELLELKERLPKSNLLKTTEAAVWICLHTCCRIGELVKAKHEHFDFDSRIWTIPEINSKNGKAHRVYMSDPVIHLIKLLMQLSSNDIWLFPNRSNTNHVDPKTLTKQIHDRQLNHSDNILTNRTKCFDALELSGGKWTLHDLRRTGATLMVSQGIAPEVVERCLNHIEPNVIKRTYQHYSYESEMRDAWIKHSTYLTSMGVTNLM